jgi:hypothetical protein
MAFDPQRVFDDLRDMGRRTGGADEESHHA